MGLNLRGQPGGGGEERRSGRAGGARRPRRALTPLLLSLQRPHRPPRTDQRPGSAAGQRSASAAACRVPVPLTAPRAWRALGGSCGQDCARALLAPRAVDTAASAGTCTGPDLQAAPLGSSGAGGLAWLRRPRPPLGGRQEGWLQVQAGAGLPSEQAPWCYARDCAVRPVAWEVVAYLYDGIYGPWACPLQPGCWREPGSCRPRRPRLRTAGFGGPGPWALAPCETQEAKKGARFPRPVRVLFCAGARARARLSSDKSLP